ncbi:MAG: phosphate signaling complex protein PhoU [Oscillatoria sp. SIO1A7]|nr:phosphate signaling complex protein PhoU [Oscillatoria sp. SIO1A7]
MADHATNIGKRVGYIVNGYRHCKGKINDLKQDTFRMAALVKNSFHLSHEALFYQNLASAEKITPIERKIDEFYRQIQSDCVFLMTLQAPDGKDSRLIGAYMQLVRDLERIGDYAQDLSEIAYKLSRYPAHPSMSCMSQIEEMFNHTQIMLAKSLVALADLDAEVGQRVKQLDLTVNRLYQQVYTTLASQQDVKGVIEPLLLLAFVIRHIERMADHATNIGQRVAFIVVSDS